MPHGTQDTDMTTNDDETAHLPEAVADAVEEAASTGNADSHENNSDLK